MSFTRKLYTSDLHLGHHGILRHCAATRPFDTVEAMDAAIVSRINDRVESSDILYVIGDFALSGDAEYVRHLFHSINGRKILILGNHDLDQKGRLRKTLASLPWDVQPQHSMETTDGSDGIHVYLSHYAHRTWPAMRRGGYHFFGHSHGDLPPLGLSRDVGIDVSDMDFGPKTFSELRETLDV